MTNTKQKPDQEPESKFVWVRIEMSALGILFVEIDLPTTSVVGSDLEPMTDLEMLIGLFEQPSIPIKRAVVWHVVQPKEGPVGQIHVKPVPYEKHAMGDSVKLPLFIRTNLIMFWNVIDEGNEQLQMVLREVYGEKSLVVPDKRIQLPGVFPSLGEE